MRKKDFRKLKEKDNLKIARLNCDSCGRKREPSAKVCAYCGAPLRELTTIVVEYNGMLFEVTQ